MVNLGGKRRLTMNSKQKVGYMALGAAILAVGIVIGQVVTPGIKAQNNGVFDKIRCSSLAVVDEEGNVAVVLGSVEERRGIFVFDKTGNSAVQLGATEYGNGVFINDKTGNSAVQLAVQENGNGVYINDKTGNIAVQLVAKEDDNSLFLKGKAGKESIIMFTGEEHGNVIEILDRAGNVTWRTPGLE